MKILVNDRRYLKEFIKLNEEWIEQYFVIEDVDRKLAQNPGKVIDKGGYIFTVLIHDEVAGVCALFNQDDDVYEIARMAVLPKFQGRGLGRKLMEICLDKLNELKVKRAYLVSNTKLAVAIAMYNKFGFTTTEEGQHPKYIRANIIMDYPLDKLNAGN